MGRVLITGAGMVGAYSARALIEAGHDVLLFDAAPRPEYVTRVVGRRVPIIRGDVRELPSVIAAVNEAAPAIVVHTAALIGEAAQAAPHTAVEVNVIGTLNVAEAVRLTGVPRLVYASTLGVNDLSHSQSEPIDEDFPLGGGGRMYGTSKVACEQLLWGYSLAYGFELACLRFAGIYGMGHFAGGSGIGQEIFELVAAAVAGRPGTIGSAMPPSFELVHVKDVAQSVLLAATVERLPHHVYNIGSGVIVGPSDVIGTVARLVPGFVGTAVPPARPNPHPRLQPFDLRRSRSELGYAPRFDLETGIRDLVAELSTVGPEPPARPPLSPSVG